MAKDTIFYKNNNLTYYIDNNKKDTRKYIIYDKKDNCYYAGFVGVRKDNIYLGFKRIAVYKIDINNITKCNFNYFDKIITDDNNSLDLLGKIIKADIDYNKLYIR